MRNVNLALLFVLFFGSTSHASANRTVDADAFSSSDKTKTFALPTNSDTLTGNTTASTLSNKIISGANNTLSQVPVGASQIQASPSGTVDGTNVTFTLAVAPPSASAVHLLLDGLTLTQGSGNDYTISGSTITMVTAPAPGQKLLAIYSQY